MGVDDDEVVGTRLLQQADDDVEAEGFSLEETLVLAGVGQIGDDADHLLRAEVRRGVRHHEQLHQPGVLGRGGGLDDDGGLPLHGGGEPQVALAVGEDPVLHGVRVDAQLPCNTTS